MPQRPTAIVIGAGSGIGRATAVLLAENGFDLVLSSRRENTLQETMQLVLQSAPATTCIIHPGDVTDPKVCQAIIDKTISRFSRIDALANVAGYATELTIAQITPEEWQRTVAGNLSYVMYMTAAAWPIFRKQRSGVIVNVSSMASVDPYAGYCLYAPAKLALNLFTRMTADQGVSIGLRAVVFAPGAVDTPMLRSMFPVDMLPANKTLDPIDVARVIVGCITGKRKFQPGETILVPSP